MKENEIKREIEVEANTLEEARSLLKKKIPKGMELLSEQVLSDGMEKSLKGVAGTMEAAFEQAQSSLPSGAEIIAKNEEAFPAEKRITIEAFDEENAMEAAKRELGNTASVRSADLTATGKNGFLGIGKKPNRYEVRFSQLAVVEVTFKEKARLRAAIGKKPKCEKCGKPADYLLPVQLMAADTGARSKDFEVCDKCFIELASGAEQMRFE